MNKFLLTLSLSILLLGCSKTPNSNFASICNQQSSVVKINDIEIKAKNACADEDKQKGLMFIENMQEGEGMLFVFEEEMPLQFWMKNTNIPLDIAYINNNNQIVDIYTMKPHDETLIKSSQNASLALEVNAGFFEKNKIKKGDFITIN